MAKHNAVWGIDIGQCGLKALRCRPNEEADRITADAFDFIEYPQILSQPEADPVELVRDALRQFLSRNVVKGDRVAVSVSGQSGLARFIKLPPVESKKIPDIVKYEARQQIPFPLDEVVWDYQQMAGGSEEEGFVLETEVGLFAMKRDQVYRALKPFEEAGIEVDVIQLTPLTIYNFAVFDLMQDLPPSDEYDPDNPPESIVVLSLGTDTTDLVVTNGYRVWQRSLPIGGSHFTKALSKELRLTFAKAEHLKRNAMQAEDQKAVFQAMRPVFNDLLTEIQRSIGFFTNIDRTAKVGRVIALGNAMKLPGLQKYLSQNLGYPVSEVESYRGLSGSSVIGSPAFKDNLLSFAVCYGLSLQGLGKGKLGTNLLPREIVTERLIRDKKPWAVATAAALLLGCTVSFIGFWRPWLSVKEDRVQRIDGKDFTFKTAFTQTDTTDKAAKQYISAFEAAKARFKEVDQIGEDIVGNVDGRLLWLELLKAIDDNLPHDPYDKPPPAKIEDRKDLHIEELEVQYYPDLSVWYQFVAQRIKEDRAGMISPTVGEIPGEGAAAQAGVPGAVQPGVPGAVAPGVVPGPPGAVPAAPPAGVPAPGVPVPGVPAPAVAAQQPGVPGPPPHVPGAGMPQPGGAPVQGAAAGANPGAPGAPGEVAEGEGPKGEGWVIQLIGYHFHNKLRSEQGAQYVRDAFLKKLEKGYVMLPVGKGGKPEKVLLADLGIGNPVLVETSPIQRREIPDPDADEPEPGEQKNGRMAQIPTIPVQQFDFVLQFTWQETPLSKRLLKKKEQEKAKPADGNAVVPPVAAAPAAPFVP